MGTHEGGQAPSADPLRRAGQRAAGSDIRQLLRSREAETERLIDAQSDRRRCAGSRRPRENRLEMPPAMREM